MMAITPIRAADARRTETPNATMTTLASPTLGASAGLSLWRITMGGGQRGPRHAFDSEQLWTVVAGTVSITAGDDACQLGGGDSLVLPAGVFRQVVARTDAELLVCGHGDAVVSVQGEDAPRGTPPWIA